MKEIGKLVKSKVTDHVIIKGQTRDNGLPGRFGTNINIQNIPFHSKNPQPITSPAAKNN